MNICFGVRNKFKRVKAVKVNVDEVIKKCTNIYFSDYLEQIASIEEINRFLVRLHTKKRGINHRIESLSKDAIGENKIANQGKVLYLLEMIDKLQDQIVGLDEYENELLLQREDIKDEILELYSQSHIFDKIFY